MSQTGIKQQETKEKDRVSINIEKSATTTKEITKQIHHQQRYRNHVSLVQEQQRKKRKEEYDDNSNNSISIDLNYSS